LTPVLLALAAAPAFAAGAQTPSAYLQRLAAQARDVAGFDGFSPARGQQFFNHRFGVWSCASCHGALPLAAGQHAKTGKQIAPLAPAANPERFTDAAKIEKWFRRNCNDVLGRECTAIEKGDVLSWLLSLR
jgi:hypothetical protein